LNSYKKKIMLRYFKNILNYYKNSKTSPIYYVAIVDSLNRADTSKTHINGQGESS